MGPFDHKPCILHVSSFMTQEKSNLQLRRTIIDLSWPKGQAVNDGVQKDSYLGTKFEMHYPSFDRIVNNLNQIGPAAKTLRWTLVELSTYQNRSWGHRPSWIAS